MINNNKPINRDNLAVVTTELKRVLHPTIITGSYEDKVAIKVTSDISFEDQFPLSFYIKCFNFIDEEEKVIFAHGYIDNNNNNSTVNLGSSKITKIAVDQDENCIVFLTEERSAILKTEAEIFISTDNKNHINTIEYLTSEEIETYTFQDIQGDSDINFEYIVKTGENEYVTIEQGGEGRIESIFHSTESESLDHPIELTIIGKDLNNNTVIQEITVNLDTNRNASNNIELTLDTDVLADTIKDSILADFPVASTSEIGGIKLDPTLSEDNKYPVQLDDDTKVAYVDLSNYQPNILLDKHRYDLNSVDPHTETTLVLHIGANSQDYITGYYYKWAPTSIDTINFVTTGWYVSDQNVLKQQLMQFDVEHDYILEDPRDRVAYILIYLKDELNIGDPITLTTNFSIKQETWFEEDITYEELNNLGFYLKDNPNYRNYTGNTNDYFILINTLVFAQPTWRQKNVQPMLKVGSPLVFKGTATWAQLQQYSATADPGDFYIVTDKSNQEWYWTGTDWEFMGDIFTLDGSFVVKTKNTSGETTVQTFKATNSGEQPIIFKEGSNVTLTPNDTTHTIEIAATDTTYVASDFDIKDLSDSTGLRTTWSGKQDVISAGDNIDITNDTVSAKGYVLTDGLNSFSEGDKSDTNRSKAKGQNSHAEGYLTRAISPYSHSEGLQTIALGYASHVEGQGRLVDLGPIDTLEHTNDEFTVKQQYINNFVVGDIVECNGGFSRISNVEYLWLTVYLESPINEAHTGDHVYSVSGAFGENSHSEGTGTITINSSEHAEGKYNVSNTNTIHSIGIGTASARKNATEVMTNGDMYLYGVGGYDGTNPSSADTLQDSLGDKNIIESVLINGTDLTPSSKAVNITVTSSNNTASFGSAVTVGTVSGVDLKFTMPANPNTDTQADWSETDNTSAAYINNKPSLATVATSGSYSDLSNTPTIPTVNNNSIMFATKSGSTLDLFSAFTLNLNYDKKIILEEGSNITLTPDDPNNIVRIDATNTTYSFSQSGNTLTITPSSGNASTYTPTLNPGTVTSITAGRGLLGGTITNSGIIDIDTQVNTPTVSNNSITINYNSNKYIRAYVGAGDTLNINVQLTSGQSGTKYAKEIIVRIDDTSTGETSPALIKVNQDGSGTLKNMYNSVISTGLNIYSGDVLELVFTFWDNNDVTFNGGISV